MGIGEEKRSLPFRQASPERSRAAARRLLHGLGANQVMASYAAARRGLGLGSPCRCITPRETSTCADTKMCVIRRIPRCCSCPYHSPLHCPCLPIIHSPPKAAGYHCTFELYLQ